MLLFIVSVGAAICKMRCWLRYSAWSKSRSLRSSGLLAKPFSVPEGDSSDLVIMALYDPS